MPNSKLIHGTAGWFYKDWVGSFYKEGTTESEFLSSFKCTNPDNRTKFCDQEFEDLYRRVEAEPNRAERLRLTHLLEKRMIEQSPVIPLYVYTQHHLQKPYVKDLAINFPDQQPLRYAWIDPDWNK